MKFLIEFEGFQLKQQFVFKEFVVLNVTTTTINHFFVKSPYPKELLSRSDEKVVNFCETFLHKIKWHSGHVHMSDVLNFLSKLPSSSIIYTKGLCKAKLLRSMLTGFEVTNLEDINCPPITKLLFESESECPLRFHKNRLNCAHRKAIAFASFLEQQDERAVN